TATETVSELDRALKKQETEWQSNQGRLSADLERHKGLITDLEQKRQLITADIDAPTIELYQGVKKQRGTAVAKVEQGICIGCRISLSVSEFQRARTGNLVRCSSCGRILFVA
ncbi:MAG: C4-type zinc ribbon domain-containing protein, partial [Dehalococcoidales bacterium]|nr:C4-type zinc ribbon domain-containing protein [Dehalococcoidales bacterium]